MRIEGLPKARSAEHAQILRMMRAEIREYMKGGVHRPNVVYLPLRVIARLCRKKEREIAVSLREMCSYGLVRTYDDRDLYTTATEYWRVNAERRLLGRVER